MSVLLAHALVQSADVDAYTLTAARLWATTAALLGLVGAVIGALTLSRAVRRVGNGGRKGAVVALASGLIAIFGGALALVVGLLAMIFGGLALSRSRSTDVRIMARSPR
jgi:hypothetical protein